MTTRNSSLRSGGCRRSADVVRRVFEGGFESLEQRLALSVNLQVSNASLVDSDPGWPVPGGVVLVRADVTNAGSSSTITNPNNAAGAITFQVHLFKPPGGSEEGRFILLSEGTQIRNTPLGPGSTWSIEYFTTYAGSDYWAGGYHLVTRVIYRNIDLTQTSPGSVETVLSNVRVTEVSAPEVKILPGHADVYEVNLTARNLGLSRVRLAPHVVLSRDNLVGNEDDVPLAFATSVVSNVISPLPGQSAVSILRVRMPSVIPSGDYSIGVRLVELTDVDWSDNARTTASPVVEITGSHATEPDMTVFGGGSLARVLTHDASAQRSNGTGFGPIVVGQSKSATYRLKNTGAQPLLISSMRTRGLVPGDFEILTTIPASIAPGANFDFVVRFTPTDFLLRAANVTIVTNDPDRTTFRMRVQGQGTADLSVRDILVEGVNSAHAWIEIPNGSKASEFGGPTHIGLTNAGPGLNSVSKLFQISNAGATNLRFTSNPGGGPPVYRLKGSSFFSIASLATPGMTLAQNGTTVIEVRFQPTKRGTFNAWIAIATNDPDEPLFRFRVRAIAQ